MKIVGALITCAASLLCVAGTATAALSQPQPTVTVFENCFGRPGGLILDIPFVRIDGLSPGEVVNATFTPPPNTTYGPSSLSAPANDQGVVPGLQFMSDLGLAQVVVSVPSRSFTVTRAVVLDCVDDPPPVPTSKDQCKNGGWRDFGSVFKNQGQCVAFVARGPKSS